MASTKFEVSMEIFKFQGEPDVSVTLTGKSPAELNTALKTLETIAKTTTLYNGDSAPEAEKSVTSEPKQAAPVVSTADKTPPQEAGKLAYARRRKGAHAPALPEMQERVCTVLARTANDQRVPEVRRENPAGRWHGSSSPARSARRRATVGRTSRTPKSQTRSSPAFAAGASRSSRGTRPSVAIRRKEGWMMKALTHNIQQEREDQRDRSAQLFMWCIVVSMHQDDGIGASRLLRACNEMDAFEKKYQTAILYGSSKTATDAMRENLKGICDFEVRLPVDRAPRGRREEQLRMASNQGAEIAWLVMAATCHETFGYGKDRLARLKQNSMNNYKQYLEWEKEDKDLALDRLRRCVQDALKEDLRVTDTDDRKGMLSTPGRGPSVYETAAVYSEIFRRARAGRAVAPLAVYSAAKYDETMTAARKRASVMLGL